MDGLIVINILMALACILFGFGMGRGTTPKDVSGYIIIDKYDPDGPYMFFELEEPIEELCEREATTVGIIVRDPNSQE